MTIRQRKERDRLHRLWAVGKATRKQMMRAMELDRMSRHAINREVWGER